MNFCNDVIEELLQNLGETERKNEGEGFKGTTVMNRLLKNLVAIVKKSNQLSYDSLFSQNGNGINNEVNLIKLKKQMAKLIYVLLNYSCSEKTKNFLQVMNDEGQYDMENYYQLVSSTLEDVISRSYDCFRFFGEEYANESLVWCKRSKNQKSNKRSDTTFNDFYSTLPEVSIKKEEEEDTIIKNEIGKSGNRELMKSEMMTDTNESEENVKKRKKRKYESEMIDNEENIKKQKKNMYENKCYFKKIQRKWLHITNNYATYFIPRIFHKYHSLVPLDETIIKAANIQEAYITKKKIVLSYLDDYYNGKLCMTSTELLEEIEQSTFNNNIALKDSVSSFTEEQEPNQCEDSSSENASEENKLLKKSIEVDAQWFRRILKKLNKEINKHYSQYKNLPHPYEYEINSIIDGYEKGEANCKTSFTTVEEELIHKVKANSVREKRMELIEKKEDLMNMIKTILMHHKIISINAKINYKKSYLGFISLLVIGTQNTTYIIDPFLLYDDLYLLNEVTTNPSILKLTYDSLNVILYLQKDFSVFIVHAFDLLIAAKYLNIASNVPFLLNHYFICTYFKYYNQANTVERPLTEQILQGIAREFEYFYDLFFYMKVDLFFNAILNVSNSKDSTEPSREKELSNGHVEKNKRNQEGIIVYVKFDQMPMFKETEEEKKRGEDMIRKVFIDSNKLCVTKYEITKVYDIEHSYEQIKTIMSNSYSSQYEDLIKDILIWRKKIAKRIDEAPDHIITIHNIISIILNIPTSISSLKNRIIPLTNVVLDHIEELFEIVVKSCMKNVSSNYYFNAHPEVYIKEKESLQSQSSSNCSFTNKKENLLAEDTNNCTNKQQVIFTNLHFQSMPIKKDEEQLSMHKNKSKESNKIQSKEDKVSTKESNVNTDLFTIEQTIFNEHEDYNDESVSKKPVEKEEDSVILFSLLNSMKKKKIQGKFYNKNQNVEKPNYKTTRKDISKKEKEYTKKNNSKKKMKRPIITSYQEQYKMPKRKNKYANNIMREMS